MIRGLRHVLHPGIPRLGLGGVVRWLRPEAKPKRPAPPAVERGEDRFVRIAFQSLALFRFLTFALGAGLVFVLNTDEPSLSRVVILVVVGVYNIVRVVRPFNPLEFAPAISWLAAASDVALSLTLVLSTDGFESAFLIFSLAPLLTVSLLMDVRSGIFFAGVAALSITGAYVAGGLGVGDYPSLVDGNYLVFALLYAAVCLLVTLLPFLANLNWERRLRAESVGSERHRLRREVHDNIAQTLAFLSLKVKRAEERATDVGMAISGRDVSEVARAVERAYLAVRDYLDGSEDVVVEPAPFGEVLSNTIAQWSRECGLRAESSVIGEDVELAPKVQRQLVQIVREALANVAKHAYPRRVSVSW